MISRLGWSGAAICLLLAAGMRAQGGDSAATQAGSSQQSSGQGTAAGRRGDGQSGGQSGGGQRSDGQRGGGRNGRGIRGTVVSVNGVNALIKTETGESWTVITTDNTRMSIDGQPIKVNALKAGDEVVAGGIPDNDKHELHALFLGGASAAQAAKLKADLGKTYIVGRITAIKETELVVMRPDKVSQTINLDEGTSLRRGGRLPAEFAMFGGAGGGGRRRQQQAGPGVPNATSGGGEGENGEAITLADVKVGDNVAGEGAIKSGTFTPTELHVQAPRPRGERGGAGAGGEVEPPPAMF